MGVGYILLTLAIVMRACTDLFFKVAVHQLHLDSLENFVRHVPDVLCSRWMILGGITAIVNIMVWIGALKYVDLSVGYTLFSLSYILIILAGNVFFHEKLDRNRIIGILFICAGSVLLVIK
ncbi:MAG: EamA family transporter [Candidatus Margulisiibacteriota bacterium]